MKQRKIASIVIFVGWLALGGCSFVQKINPFKPKPKTKTVVEKNKPEAETNDVRSILCEGVELLYASRSGEIVAIEAVLLNTGEPRTPGLEAITLQALLRCGTQTLRPEAFKQKADDAGVRFTAYTAADYSSIRMECPRKNLTIGFQLLSDALLSPVFDYDAFVALRDEIGAKLLAEGNREDLYTEIKARAYFFAKHPYGQPLWGDYEKMAVLPPDSASAFYGRTLTKNRLKFVAVGDLDLKSLTKQIGVQFGLLPETPTNKTVKPKEPVAQTGQILPDTTGAEAALAAVLPQYLLTDRETVALWLAFSLLKDRLEAEICTRRYLSCQITAQFNLTRSPYTELMFKTATPGPTLKAVHALMKTAWQEGFAEEELAFKKNAALMPYFTQTQTAAGQAALLAEGLAKGKWRLQTQWPALVQTITAQEVNNVFRKRFNRLNWLYIGEAGKINPTMLQSPKPEPIMDRN